MELDHLKTRRGFLDIWRDREGKSIDVEHANRLLGNHFYCVIERTEIHEAHNPWISVTVSTVWRAVAVWENDLFETMLFPTALGEDALGIGGDHQWRYATEKQAAEAHRHITRNIRALFIEPVAVNRKARAILAAPVRLAIMKGESE